MRGGGKRGDERGFGGWALEEPEDGEREGSGGTEKGRGRREVRERSGEEEEGRRGRRGGEGGGEALEEAVGFQLAGEGAVAGADRLQEGVELWTVVEVAEVAEFVEHDKVAKMLREAHEVEIEVDVAQFGAAAPVGRVMLDADLVVGEAVESGELGEAGRQGRLGLGAQPLHLGRLFGGQGFLLTAASADNKNHRALRIPRQR